MDERMRIKEKIRGRKKPSTSFRKDLFDSTQEGGKLTGSMKECQGKHAKFKATKAIF
jgi:hypothetical protein